MWQLWVYFWIFIFAMFIGFLWLKAEFHAVQKYYPDITMWEYFILNDKLRITPSGD